MMPSFHGHADFELKARDHRRNEVSRACKICMLSQGIIAVLISNAGKPCMPCASRSCLMISTSDGIHLSHVMQRTQDRSDPACYFQCKHACNHTPMCCSKLNLWRLLLLDCPAQSGPCASV